MMPLSEDDLDNCNALARVRSTYGVHCFFSVSISVNVAYVFREIV